MSVFETVVVFQGAPLFVREHLDRLRLACQAAEFVFPESLTAKAVGELITDDVSGSLRVYVSAGDGGPSAPVTVSRTYALFEPSSSPDAGEVDLGWRLDVSRAPFPTILGGWKTANYWPSIQALQEAKRGGFQEAIVLNAQGAVISASMGNLFAVMGGSLVTPALSMGARDGVLRAWVMEQEPVEETLLSLDDLSAFEECFITNSRIGVMPVASIADRVLPSFETGRRLAKLYREKILLAR
jgi:branched-subunit amino acid aminotransferase/4-amino-4-deoxychorismate lyase